MLGAGKYDELCTYVREQAQAEGTLLLVLGGTKGNGFSLQADLVTTLRLPAILRDLAARIEADGGPLRAGKR
jgi:hypothetical protein